MGVRICFASIFVAMAAHLPNSFSQDIPIRHGEVWNDVFGMPINAHGGGILYSDGYYFWFGEVKSGETYRVVKDKTWENYRVPAGGISCYSSKDLMQWKYEGLALAPVPNDSTSDLHTSKVIERPKVVYNNTTKQFVMWVHVDTDDYGAARAGVAISNNIKGPYKYLYSLRPNWAMSRDMTVFKDDDGRAYLISSSESNATMLISELKADYLSTTGRTKKILINNYREAPVLIKHNGKYYLVTSGCSGWDANASQYAVADSVMGDWQAKENPCVGKDGEKTFYAQGSFILQLEGNPGSYLFMADKWNKRNLADSRYLWLPLWFEGDKMRIGWKKE